MTDRNDLHLLAGAYALGALSDAERVEFEAYLATSEEARAEVAALTDTAVELGLAATPVQPPASLKRSLMAQIAVTPQLSPLEVPAEPETCPASSHSNPRARSGRLGPPRRRAVRRLAGFAVPPPT